MSGFWAGRFLSTVLALLGGLLGGCPAQPDAGNPVNAATSSTVSAAAADTSRFSVVKTDIPVVYDASLECGDDLIVFGTGAHAGVSYIVPSTHPTAATPIPGDYRSQGFAVAGHKVLLFNDEGRLVIYDAASATSTEIPLPQITLDGLPANDDVDRDSPVVADGHWAVTRNASASVDGGCILKLLDLRLDPPQIIPLPNPPADPTQIVISAADHAVVTFGGDQFFIYNIARPASDPQVIDLSAQGGIAGPFAYDAGYIIYFANASSSNIRLLKVSDGTSLALSPAPAHSLLPVAIKGGKYAYFLNREPFDSSSVVYRAAIGVVPEPTATVPSVPGDPATHNPPWASFGDDVAITPDGRWIFIAGDQVILESGEFLQASSGGAFGAFADGSGFLNASDVDASASLVAFKTGRHDDTRLGYIILPD